MKARKPEVAQVNDKIRALQLQLITHEGQNVGVISKYKALEIARVANLDLVLISSHGNEGVPVAKIMDYGKSLYEKKKKLAEAKKHQKVIQVKEIKIKPKIGQHDYETKIKQAVKFLKSGKRVKLTLFFRGRENITKQERGPELFARVEKSFKEFVLPNLAVEKESKIGQFWFRIYYIK